MIFSCTTKNKTTTTSPQRLGANNTVGSPEAGQTNQQNWTEHGVAIAGEVVEIDDLTTRAQIDGYLDETWVQP